MATLRTRWLLSILLVNLPNSCAAAGPPASPSNLECYMPCDDNNCRVDIHCIWDPRPDPQIPTNYSLHWESAYSEEGHVTNGTSLNGFICREQYSSHSDLRVWVQAKNQHGSAKSQDVVFNTADIIKPSPPYDIISSHPLEIFWISTCDHLQLSLQQCDIRHRTEADQVWNEDKGAGYHSYTFNSPQPGIVYEFQVRCGCSRGLMSDWSEIHRASSETAPVGKLDLWRDCGMYPTSVDCVLTWKKLPLSQARGHILGYEFTLSDSNGAVSVNVSTDEPKGLLVCDKMQCHLNSSLKDVLSASVSAYNAHGATRPSNLTIPIRGKEKNEQPIHLNMNEENLTVSWDLPSQLSDNLSYKEYVVQYKQAGSPLGQGFDWVLVKKGHTTGIFKGQFIKYTPYQVSLFTVSNSRECHHRSSVIGYSLQGTPSRVPSFKVDAISATHVTLFWEPVPLSKQNGLILYYQIGIDRQKVKLNVSKQHENTTFELLHLSPGQEYEVWIRAVTSAGPGANATTRFKTKNQEDFAHLIPVLLVTCILVIICCLVCLLSACRGESKACPLVPSCFYEKVPDPHNSRIFREMKHQINDPLAWMCIPVNEPHPEISLLEVVEIQPRAFESSPETVSHPDGLTRPAVGDGSSQIDCQDGDQREDAVIEECDRTEHRYGREAYSKMLDSDEERDREEEDRDDSWSSSEEEQFTSGYEKHFMPTVQEVLEV